MKSHRLLSSLVSAPGGTALFGFGAALLLGSSLAVAASSKLPGEIEVGRKVVDGTEITLFILPALPPQDIQSAMMEAMKGMEEKDREMMMDMMKKGTHTIRVFVKDAKTKEEVPEAKVKVTPFGPEPMAMEMRMMEVRGKPFQGHLVFHAFRKGKYEVKVKVERPGSPKALTATFEFDNRK